MYNQRHKTAINCQKSTKNAVLVGLLLSQQVFKTPGKIVLNNNKCVQYTVTKSTKHKQRRFNHYYKKVLDL